MRITVKLFAIVRERAGQSELTLELPAGSAVAAASEALALQLPAVKNLLARAAFAINQTYAARDAMLHDGDELAVIPPVSGG